MPDRPIDEHTAAPRRRWAIARPPSSMPAIPVWTVTVAAVLSTQFLTQPFVWNNYPLDEIVGAWGVIFRNRLVVSASIACFLLGAAAMPSRHDWMRGPLIALAIVAGASTGESALTLLGVEAADLMPGPFAIRTFRWCIVGIACAGAYLLHRRWTSARATLHDASLRAARIERQAVESRLQLLRAQIEPHFLFNTLATIRRLHRSAPSEGAAMLANFNAYLRASIPHAAGVVPMLDDELALVRAYLELAAVRQSGRLRWSMEIDPTLGEQPFPALMLATLVENAIKHGIMPSRAGGEVAVCVRRVHRSMEVCVVDTGVGLGGATGGSGIGLANTRARLASLYSSAATLTLMHNAPHGVRAVLRIPLA